MYRLDGALRHIPHEHGFPGLDRSQRGLVPVASVERGGLVVVDQDGSAGGLGGPGGSGGLDELYELDELPDVIGGDQELLDSGELTVEVNWKILVEGFLEGYHIKATHPETFFPFGYDNLTVVESAGRHSRVTFPFRRIEALRDRPEEQRHIDGLATVVHHLFPNVIVAQLSHHTTMVVLEPIAVDRTTLVTYRLAERGTAARASAARDVDFVALGALEDQDMARAVQLGLASGGNDVLEFGRFEGAITHFHRQLATLLGDEPASPGPETSDRP